MRYSKRSLTFEQQADLIISRGMIADRDLLISRLHSVNYYRLSGYWHPFKTSENKFETGTTFETVWQRYRFDRQLRIYTMDAIERVEVAIRTQLTSILTKKYGAFAHTNYNNFPNTSKAEHTLFIRRIKKEVKRSQETFVKHFDAKYGDTHNLPPLWMTVELIPFGTTFTMFMAVDDSIKKEIASQYGVSDVVMESWLRALNSIRNTCAHHARLWNRQFGCKPTIPKRKKHPQWYAPTPPANDRLFIILLILKYMMDTIAPQSKWAERIESLLEDFNDISVKYMGFPDNWKESPIWEKGKEEAQNMPHKYKPYPKYEDSGVEWVGDVPEGWETIKLKHCLTLVTKKASNKTFPIALENIESWTGRYIKTGSDFEGDGVTFKEDDILFGKLRPYLAKVLHANRAGEAVGDIFVYRPQATSDGSYYAKVLRTKEAINIIDSSTYGAKMPRASSEFIGEFRIPTPPIHEQRAIAAFLDHETGKVDELIEKQQKLIELLDEKRQAVISHAVTKGLNPNAPMKDSGIEWLGDVPKHWKVAPLKRLAGMIGGYAFNSNDFTESGVQLLKIANVYKNRLSLERQPTFLPNDFVKKHTSFVINRNDIIMSLTGTLGKRDYGFAVLINNDGPFLLNQRVAKLQPDKRYILPSYLVKLLHSNSYLDQLYSLPSGTKQANLSNNDVLNIKVTFPRSLEEQTQVAKYVDNNLVKFDKLISKAKSAIDLMRERRTALISAAVTGKIDVRENV